MSVVSPDLWKSLQFGDQNAFVDFLGHHELWHRAVGDVATRFAQVAVIMMPLGDGPIADGSDWHQIHQQMTEALCTAFGIPGPPDFTAYDLNKRDDFNTYTWLHAIDSVRIMQAAGL